MLTGVKGAGKGSEEGGEAGMGVGLLFDGPQQRDGVTLHRNAALEEGLSLPLPTQLGEEGHECLEEEACEGDVPGETAQPHRCR